MDNKEIWQGSTHKIVCTASPKKKLFLNQLTWSKVPLIISILAAAFVMVFPLIIWQGPPLSALAITPCHHQTTHVFAHGRKNMNDIFNNYVCSASHMRPELHFQNVWREPWLCPLSDWIRGKECVL